MKNRLAKLASYHHNPVLFVGVYVYVMADKIVRCMFVRGYQPKRIYF